MKTMLTILASVVFAAPALAATVGMEMVLPASPQSAHWPSVAYGDGKYLVVWHSGVSGLGEGSHIYACRLDETGRVLDPRPFVVCKAPQWQERPRVAWGKGSWLVVWGDLRNGKDYDVYGARVSADGKVLDLDGILIATGEHN